MEETKPSVRPVERAVPLAGGRLTNGVVRVGDTVRRPSSASSAFTAALLRALGDRGFAGAPAYLGQDEQGRDILTYVPGAVPRKWRRFADAQVRLAAALLRAFHDDPLEDLGYMGWSWCVSSKASREPVTAQAAQLRVLVDAYGLDASDRRRVPDAMVARQRANIAFREARRSLPSTHVASAPTADGVVAWSRRELAYTQQNRATFLEALA